TLAEGYERVVARLDSLAPDASERPSPEEEEKIRSRARGLAAAAEWAAAAYPDPETELKWETLSPRLDAAAAAGELSADAAWGARAAGDDGLVFRIDLEDDEPGFDSPFQEGMIVGRDRILLWTPFLPEPLDLAAMAGEKGELVVDVRAWGETVKMILMHVGPMFAVLHLIQYLIARLLQALLGCAVVYAVASIYKIGRVEFRKAFAAAVFSLTVPVVLGMASALLPAPVPMMWLIFLGTYLLYCGLAARHLGELRR
ncbi:MAG TPA: DUF1189 family protein, partial [bacterium]|nr:DUF1189 family protein [bacterium]